MIKINLALKKTPDGLVESKTTVTGQMAGFKLAANIDLLKDFPVAKFAVMTVVLVGAWFFTQNDRETNLLTIDTALRAETELAAQLNAEIAKAAGYEPIKKQLEKDEFTLKTKIETIEKLLSERQAQYKAFLALSQSIPADIWLTDYRSAMEGGIVISGKSLGFGQISDFMKVLNENVFFAGLNLESSQQEMLQGKEIANFSLTSKGKR